MRIIYKSTLIFFVAVSFMVVATILFLFEREQGVVQQAVADFVAPPAEPAESAIFLGDIMLARDVEVRLKDKSIDYVFESLSELKLAQVVVGNFEASVPRVHVPTPDLMMKFSVATSLLPILTNGGITHLSLANNHSFDNLEEGYRNTVRELRTVGLNVFGHPAWVGDDSVSYFELRGKVFALIGINATYGEPRVSEWQSVLEMATGKSDHQIVYIHWGEEYAKKHNSTQSDLAYSLIDAGVDIIVGHHPHVVQDIERYNDGIIFYSLGNFIFDQYFNRDVQEGLMLELVVAEDGARIVLHPVESRTVKVRPQKMVGQEPQAFHSHQA